MTRVKAFSANRTYSEKVSALLAGLFACFLIWFGAVGEGPVDTGEEFVAYLVALLFIGSQSEGAPFTEMKQTLDPYTVRLQSRCFSVCSLGSMQSEIYFVARCEHR